MTSPKTSSLPSHPSPQQVVQNLDEPVRLLIFAPTPNPEEERLLNNYRRLSDRFSYEFIDPQANPVKAQQFGVRVIGEVYLEQGDGGDPSAALHPNPIAPAAAV
ncbi:MAG: GldG family protein [Verrucomicrobia bacterium]|nr:GldG family protein [Verrucomicrobiota bacterium]